jgi:hypothetical protein
MLLNVTAPGLRQHQVSLDNAVHAIRAQFDPRQSVILTVTGQDPYRFMMYYLPEYRVVRLDPQHHSMLAAHAQQQGTWRIRGTSDCLVEESGVRHAVWVLSPTFEPGSVPSDATPVTRAEQGPFQVWQRELGPETPDYLGFALGADCVAAIGGVSEDG